VSSSAAAWARIASSRTARSVRPWTSFQTGCSAAIERWLCASMNPGVSVAPSTSMTAAPAGTTSEPPAATIRSPPITPAAAGPSPGTIVRTVPPTRALGGTAFLQQEVERAHGRRADGERLQAPLPRVVEAGLAGGVERVARHDHVVSGTEREREL